MLYYELKPRGKTYLVEYYHEWDIVGKTIVDHNTPFKSIKEGDYFRFNDGSKLFAKVYKTIASRKHKDTGLIKMNTGMFHYGDYFIQTIPKMPSGSYSGIDYKEEHLLVRMSTKKEEIQATAKIRGDKCDPNGNIIKGSPRLRAIMNNIVATKVRDMGFSEDMYLLNLVKWANGNNQIAYSANNDLGDLLGVSPRAVERSEKNSDVGRKMFGEDTEEAVVIEAQQIECQTAVEIVLPTSKQISSVARKLFTTEELAETNLCQ